ncbi:hypothetical protein Droror1_Dr00013288 [Drosera rotundifolia]
MVEEDIVCNVITLRRASSSLGSVLQEVKLRMPNIQSDSSIQVETTCGSLLYELQVIWDEVGETEPDRDKMLLELEQECLEVYRRKVDHANRNRAQLRQAIADREAELAAICSAMGERPLHIRQIEQKGASLKEELKVILPQLEEMQKRKLERKKQFSDILEQMQKVSSEIHGSLEYLTMEVVDDSDLSIRKLEDLQRQLQTLQTEKSDRMKQVMQHLNNMKSLCSVLGLDFKQTVTEVHPGLTGSEDMYSITNATLQSLESAIKRLRELKVQRMQKFQDLGTTMLELWNLMDTPLEEQQAFQNVTCNVASSEQELNEPNILASDFIAHVETEVTRLEELKSSKMKELVLKKRSELEQLCQKTHITPDTDVEIECLIEAIESGALDPASVLEQIELDIGKVKEEAFSRKDILDRVDKWLSACEEEAWLEEYNMDENRYNSGRGAHLTLKRAEKARALVNKLPGMVEGLAGKTRAWESERGTEFMYDGVPLLSMLEEYCLLRQEKEQERKRQREQKKLQGQLIAEQETLFGSKPSPLKVQAGKKSSRISGGNGTNGRPSTGGSTIQTPRLESAHSARATPFSRSMKKGDRNLDDDSIAPSTVRRGLDIGGLPTRANSFNGHEPEAQITRRPFSPISSRLNLTTMLEEDPNRPPNDQPEKQVLKHDAFQQTVTSTPVKPITPVEEENIMTPRAMPIPFPSTPSTVSAPMQTCMTPALPRLHAPSSEEEAADQGEMEYSFEEQRAGFVLQNSGVKRAIQV